MSICSPAVKIALLELSPVSFTPKLSADDVAVSEKFRVIMLVEVALTGVGIGSPKNTVVDALPPTFTPETIGSVNSI